MGSTMGSRRRWECWRGGGAPAWILASSSSAAHLPSARGGGPWLGVRAGVGGASVDPRVVLIGGLSAMVASGVSMAGGAYLATKSQREVFEGQLERERAEIAAMPELETADVGAT